MKKHIVIATGLAVLSTSAYATKARMSALGQDENYGSHYIQDTRNIFRNAAHVNTFTNYIVTEWGDDATAEGGFFREHGAFNYGLYLGNTIGDIDSGDFKSKQDTIDLFFGGDTGAMQWGANLHYAASKNEKTANNDGDVEHSAFGIGLGMVMGDIEGYFNYRFNDDHEGLTGGAADAEVERSIMLIGGSYSLGDMTFFASYGVTDFEPKGGDDVSETTIELGVGRIHEVSSTSRFFVDLTFTSYKEEVDNRSDDEKRTMLPVTIGYEGDATSWLTLRGSISQNVFLGTEESGGNKRAMDNSTAVNAGATLNFGSLMVDGMIGAGNNTDDVLSLGDNFMSKVAVHYWF